MSAELRLAITNGIEKAQSAAREQPWYIALQDVVPYVLQARGIGEEIDAVDFWDELRARGYTEFKHMSAMGAVMRRLAKSGILVFMGHAHPRHTDGHGFHCKWLIINL